MCRRFQFSLKWLFLLTFVAAVLIMPSVWFIGKCRDWFDPPPMTIHVLPRYIEATVDGVKIYEPAPEYKMPVIRFGDERRGPIEL